jgi:hypothetical protein
MSGDLIQRLKGRLPRRIDRNVEVFVSSADLQEVISTLESFQWIPVSERLPEPSMDILVVDKDGFVTEANYSLELQEFITDDGHAIRDVTHWMPLPSPPTPTQGE